MMRFSKCWFIFRVGILLVIGGFWLAACTASISTSPNPRLVDNPVPIQDEISSDVAFTETALPRPSPTSTATSIVRDAQSTPTSAMSKPTLLPNPDDLEIFHPDGMKSGVLPVAYLEDTCYYLENRWGEGKSQPGTVVVPIMFHSVIKRGRTVTDTTSISMEDFEYFMQTAKEMGFETITTAELVGFLESNQAIPERSMIIILDDRRPGVTELFMSYLQENDWTLTLGWIATDRIRTADWEKMAELAETGRLDAQSHGYNHIYIQDYMTVEDIEAELYQSMDAIEARFGTKPIAYVWPGGNFNETAIDIAQSAGYQIGFTAYSRGPILFNWIPLGEPERTMDAPLMLLPRFWSTAAVRALEEGLMISQAAQRNSEAVKAAELTYLATYCEASESE